LADLQKYTSLAFASGEYGAVFVRYLRSGKRKIRDLEFFFLLAQSWHSPCKVSNVTTRGDVNPQDHSPQTLQKNLRKETCQESFQIFHYIAK
jgi:hypothetical protein